MSKAGTYDSAYCLVAGIDIRKLTEEVAHLERRLFTGINDLKVTWKWQDVVAALQAGEAVIEVVRFRKYYNNAFSNTVQYGVLISTVHTTEHPILVLLENGNELEGKYAKAYRQLIDFKLSSLNDARAGKGGKPARDTVVLYHEMTELYQNFWSPIAQVLKKHLIKKVYLSVDGIYHKINLNALRNPETGQYIIDELDIRLVTSTRNLIDAPMMAPAAGKGSAALIGSPKFNIPVEEYDRLIDIARHTPLHPDHISYRNVTRATWWGGHVPELPGTKSEVETIAALLSMQGWRIDTMTGPMALEERIKGMQNPQILHIATHGYFEADVETQRKVVSRTDSYSLADNPLLRSGLLLAGAENSLRSRQRNQQVEWQREDGILTAFEASNLQLENSELVVLSACETGLGEIKNGEGVYGLQRAFMMAGAKALLFSLWKVDDRATYLLMATFYLNWLNGATKREAFRVAQLYLREEYRDPYYWAAFVMLGE